MFRTARVIFIAGVISAKENNRVLGWVGVRKGVALEGYGILVDCHFFVVGAGVHDNCVSWRGCLDGVVDLPSIRSSLRKSLESSITVGYCCELSEFTCKVAALARHRAMPKMNALTIFILLVSETRLLFNGLVWKDRMKRSYRVL